MLFRSKELSTPCLFGVVCPAIYLPKEQTDAQIDTQKDVQIDVWTNAQKNVQTDAQTNAQINAQIDAQTNIQINAQADTQTDMHTNVRIKGQQADIQQIKAQMQKYVLLHEYTHYRHGDHIWAVLRCLCQPVLVSPARLAGGGAVRAGQ